MGACNEGMRKLLMPAEGSCTRDWEGFGDVEEGSLLMISHLGMAAFSTEATRELFLKGLGAADRDCLEIGSTQLRLEKVAGEADTSTWPGQMYIWVENLQSTWQNYRTLETSWGSEVVESAVCCHDERAADALVLRDPGTVNALVVNQAPKGYADALRKALGKSDKSNLVCLMDLLFLVPKGVSAQLGSFYQRFLSACVTKSNDGYRLHFGAGDFLRQTFTFRDDESQDDAWKDSYSHEVHLALSRSLCFYVDSEAKFRIAFSKFSKAGLVAADWKAVESAGEFSFEKCLDANGSTILELRHVIRSPKHTDCPIKSQPVDSTLMGA